MIKTILITGASRGIGLETARSLADSNHQLIITARTSEPLKEIQNAYPSSVTYLTADLSKTIDIESIKNHIQSNNVTLHGLINNAGVLINKPFSDQTDEEWMLQIKINLLAPVRLIRTLLPYFSKDSHIVNIGSMGGFQGSSKFSGLSAYSASKGALSILTECLAAELSDKEISCNCLCLGAVYTEMLQEAFPEFKPPVTAEEMGTYIADFILNSHKFYNGKIIPVALNDPE